MESGGPRVVAFRQDNNGDVLLCGPALRAIRARADRLTLVCGPTGVAAARTLPAVDSVITAEAAWIAADPAPVARGAVEAFVDELAALRADVAVIFTSWHQSPLPAVDSVITAEAAWIAADPAPVARGAVEAFVDELAALRADVAVIFTSWHQSPLPAALLARMAGIARTAAISVDYGGALLDVRHRVDDDIHEVERALSLAAAAGFPQPANDDGRLAMRVATSNPLADLRPYVVVHPGATVPARAWDPERNRALVAGLAARGDTVVVTGGASEAELCAFVAGDVATNAAGAFDFATFGRAIADADVVVCGNTGAAHVAAAVGTPIVELFPPTIPAIRFAPWRVPHRILGDQEIACRGCRARICPIPGQPCLDVALETVLAAVSVVRRASVF
jgi:ADP-heptose:LPS heptosyltransferase